MAAQDAGGEIPVWHGLRWLFFNLLVRPFVLLGLGLHVRGTERLPSRGGVLVAANHNSHLDAFVLVLLLARTRPLRDVRVVAAGDYFSRSRALWWFVTRVIGIVPLVRPGSAGSGGRARDGLRAARRHLEAGRAVILFPEGSRGDPETLASAKPGLAHLAQKHPRAPVLPVFLHGCGRALPRGEALFVPHFCDGWIGEPLSWQAATSAAAPRPRRTAQFLECYEAGIRALQSRARSALPGSEDLARPAGLPPVPGQRPAPGLEGS